MTTYDMASLKAYVTEGKARQVAAGQVLLDVTHNLLQARRVEIVFNLFDTIARIKDKVCLMNGSRAEHTRLLLNNRVEMDDAKCLNDYGATNGQVIHMIDEDPYSQAKGGALEDVSQVKKYEMSDEAYAARDNTYLAYKKKMLAADPNWKPKHAKGPTAFPPRAAAPKVESKVDIVETKEESLARIRVGMRCQVTLGGKRGEVMYIGLVPEIPVAAGEEAKLWVGVKYDEPLGKNDGSIKGKRYWTCRANYGGFVIPGNCRVGDYPERDIDDEDSDDDSKDSKAAAPSPAVSSPATPAVTSAPPSAAAVTSSPATPTTDAAVTAPPAKRPMAKPANLMDEL